MRRIVSLEARPLQWLVGEDQEELMREPFGEALRTVTVHVVPKDRLSDPLSEGGASALITLACGHQVEWEQPVVSTLISTLDEWIGELQQKRLGHHVRCWECEEVQDA